jgi:hypothetical protein
MKAQADAIVDISMAQVRFFGGPGNMLIPCVVTVEALIHKDPASRLITTGLLRKMLADQFKVQGTCPVTTRKALQAIANDSSKQVAYWRVIKQNGELSDRFPGGVEGKRRD